MPFFGEEITKADEVLKRHSAELQTSHLNEAVLNFF